MSNNYTIFDQLSQLLALLSQYDPRLQPCNIQERVVNNLAGWLTASEQFCGSCKLGLQSGGDKAVLFCYRSPEIRKTLIRYQGLSPGERSEFMLAILGDSWLIEDTDVIRPEE